MEQNRPDGAEEDDLPVADDVDAGQVDAEETDRDVAPDDQDLTVEPAAAYRRPLLAGAVALALAFLLSAGLYLLTDQPYQRRLLWFPDTAGARDHAEWHSVPTRDTERAAISALIAEIALGPVELGAVPYIPEATEVQSLVLDRERRLFVDFSSEIMFASAERETNLSDLFEYLDRTIRHNFRRVTDVQFTIDGHLPGQPIFSEAGR